MTTKKAAAPANRTARRAVPAAKAQAAKSAPAKKAAPAKAAAKKAPAKKAADPQSGLTPETRRINTDAQVIEWIVAAVAHIKAGEKYPSPSGLIKQYRAEGKKCEQGRFKALVAQTLGSQKVAK